MKKKFLALVMTLSMVLSLVPMTALAAGDGEPTGQSTMTAENQAAGADANEGKQDSDSNADSDSTTTSGGGSNTDTSKDPDTNTGDKDESKNGESENTGETTPGSPSKPEGGGTKGGGTGSGAPSAPETSTGVAKIGTTEYATIAGAIATANNNDTIELLCDVTENITINKPLTLDLAGFTLTGADEKNAVVTITGSDESKPAVTIKSSKVDGEKPVNGTITGGKKSGIRITNADVTLKNLTVTKNASTGSGGGIDAVKGEKLVVEQCAINENSANNIGGGIHVEDTPLKVVDSEIKNNQGYLGAGIYLSDPQTPVCGCHKITGTHIEGNKVFDDNGIGGGIYVGTRSQVNIENSTISKNVADQGGGIVAYTADSVVLNHVVITENQATVGAGILTLTIHACNTEFKLTNNTEVKNNTATYYGGGVMAWGDGSDGIKQVVTVENSSISNNNAKDGAGIFINLQDTATNAFVTINLGVGAVVQGNTATRNGGGIFARNLGDTAVSKGTINVAEGSALYNNTAEDAGDDLYLKDNTTFTLPKASKMSGGCILSSDNAEITGWYHDGCKWNPTANEGQGGFEKIDRWTAATADEYIPTENDTQAITLKAAHPLMYTLTYNVTGDAPENYTAPKNQTLKANEKYTVAEVPASVTGTKDGVNGTFSFNGWKKDDGTVLTGEQQLTADLTLHGEWTFTKKSSSGGHRPSNPPVTIPDDVPTGLNGKDHYAYVVGYPDGMVYPQKNITRAEVATIFFRLLTDETREANMTKSNGYNDMKDGAWYTCAVSTLSKMGIIKGYEDGSFKPDASISRAEFAAIAARFDPDGDKTPATFSDVSSHWAKDEISIAANHGWIKGYEDGSFKPDQKITRAETMTLVNRVLKRLPETKDDLHKDMKTWPDNQNESAWFYLAVQEATNSHYQKLKKDGTHEKWESMRETRDWAALEK